MRRLPLIAFAIAMSAAISTTEAQFSTAHPIQIKKGSVTTHASPAGGGWLNTDDCNTAHRAGGSGDQFGIPFVTGTTGTEGQNEASCYFFATTGIDNDTWWDWSSTATGFGTLTSCAGTMVDTKFAVWPANSACPADGSSIACNDDACGLRSSVSFNATAGTSYTFQIGTFPGVNGGGGTFDVTVSAPPPCGVYDDGSTENALGLSAGGDMGWLHYIDCFNDIQRVETAYGTIGGAGPNNGNPSIIAIYEDADCDGNPTTGPPLLVFSVSTTVMNSGTDILNVNPTGVTLIASHCSWVLATATQGANRFPAPMDTTNPTPKAWIVGRTPTGARMDIGDINNNNVSPRNAQAVGFPIAWVLRADGSPSNIDPTGTMECFGTSACPCGNDGDGKGGCDNGAHMGGAVLDSAGGNATIGADTLVLEVTRSPGQPGIFFQGDNSIGNPIQFGDGLRCCGTNVIRVGTYSGSTGTINTATSGLINGIGPPISTHPGNFGLRPGDSRCYQWWVRDPSGPCGGSFNLSNALSITWN